MKTRRAQRAKGNQFEYSCRDSLLQIFPDTILTKQEGFQTQIDLMVPSKKIFIECKRHKGFSWNELEAIFRKLCERTTVWCMKNGKDANEYTPLLLFQANRQPCLVMEERTRISWFPCVQTFKSYFGVPFLEHNRRDKNEKSASGTGNEEAERMLR